MKIIRISIQVLLLIITMIIYPQSGLVNSEVSAQNAPKEENKGKGSEAKQSDDKKQPVASPFPSISPTSIPQPSLTTVPSVVPTAIPTQTPPIITITLPPPTTNPSTVQKPAQSVIEEAGKVLDNSEKAVQEETKTNSKSLEKQPTTKDEQEEEDEPSVLNTNTRTPPSQQVFPQENFQREIIPQTNSVQKVLEKVLMPSVEAFSRPIYTAAYQDKAMPRSTGAMLLTMAFLLASLGILLLGIPTKIAQLISQRIGQSIPPIQTSAGVRYEG